MSLPRHYAQGIAVAGLLGLLAVQLVWHGWLHPATRLQLTIFFVVVTSLPLAAFAVPVALGWRRAQFWASCLALVYFVHGVGEAYAQPAVRVLAVAEIAGALLLIGGTVLRPARD